MKLKIECGQVVCPKTGCKASVKKMCRGGFGRNVKECDHFGWEETVDLMVCRYSAEREKRLNGTYLTV